jgi:hypothetical protein
MQIAVYRSEREAGLEQRIRSSTSIAMASVARLGKAGELTQQTMARLRALADVKDFYLHHLTTILVTVGWNKNDDVFDPVEAWAARHTPEDKPLNYEHDHAKIVGHITANWVVGADEKVIADDTVAEDLPAKFHIVTGAVLYKHWQTPALQEQMESILAQIAKGELSVSMECLFQGFDYAMKSRSGATRVVARNERTAFLTKHLRAYGGNGRYGDDQVGRVLRNIVFSGKGLVKNPANPESVILSEGNGTASGSVQTAIASWLRDHGSGAGPVAGPHLSPLEVDVARCFGAGR